MAQKNIQMEHKVNSEINYFDTIYPKTTADNVVMSENDSRKVSEVLQAKADLSDGTVQISKGGTGASDGGNAIGNLVAPVASMASSELSSSDAIGFYKNSATTGGKITIANFKKYVGSTAGSLLTVTFDQSMAGKVYTISTNPQGGPDSKSGR